MDLDTATGRDRDELVRLTRWRWPILVTVALAATILAGGRGDWDFFVDSGRAMFGADGFSVYARRGDTQTGPLTLLLARILSVTPRNGFLACGAACVALGLLAAHRVERIARRSLQRPLPAQMLSLLGGACLLAWWGQLSGFGHLDDALVLAIVAVVVERRVHRDSRLAPLLVGLAIGVKPWAVFFLPLTLPFSIGGVSWAGLRTREGVQLVRRALFGPVVAVVIAAACWGPFVLADSGTLRALRPTVNLAPDSPLALVLSETATVPEWLRSVQLLLGLLLGLLLVLRHRAVALPLGCIALRILIDPGTWAYYTPGLLLGALLLDARAAVAAPAGSSRAMWPAVTLIGVVLLAPRSLLPSDSLAAAMRAAACIAGVAVAWHWNAPAQDA